MADLATRQGGARVQTSHTSFFSSCSFLFLVFFLTICRRKDSTLEPHEDCPYLSLLCEGRRRRRTRLQRDTTRCTATHRRWRRGLARKKKKTKKKKLLLPEAPTEVSHLGAAHTSLNTCRTDFSLSLYVYTWTTPVYRQPVCTDEDS